MAAYLKWLLLACLLLLPTSGTAADIKCYHCDSTENILCKDKAKFDDTIDECMGTGCMRLELQGHVMRSCVTEKDPPDMCKDETFEGVTGKACVCLSNLCNTAAQVKVSVMSILGALVLVISLY